MRDEVTGEWRRLYTEELNDMHSSPDIVHVFKLRIMRKVGQVACMLGQERWMQGSAGEIQGQNTTQKTLVLDGRIILKKDPQEVG